MLTGGTRTHTTRIVHQDDGTRETELASRLQHSKGKDTERAGPFRNSRRAMQVRLRACATTPHLFSHHSLADNASYSQRPVISKRGRELRTKDSALVRGRERGLGEDASKLGDEAVSCAGRAASTRDEF